MSLDAHEETPSPAPNNPEPDPTEKSTPPPKKRNYKWGRRIFLGLIGLVLLAVLGYLVVAAQNLPSLAEIENPRASLSTQLISSDGEVLQNYYTQENRVQVGLHEISPHMLNALIATEDARFYRHSGMDPQAPLAILKDLITRFDLRGGSTLSMQLARNLFIDQVGFDRSIFRKVRELIVAFILERKFTKQEILAAYLNTVNIYGNAYGVEMAAQRLFDKPARDLTLEESALMVGMLKGQGSYNPYTKAERTLNRRNTVLANMVKTGLLDPALADSVKKIPLETSLVQRREQDHVSGIAPYFREYARQFLKEWCEENGYNLYTDGLRVYTTLDSRLQRHAESAVDEHLSDLQATFSKHIKGREPWKEDDEMLNRLVKRSERYLAMKRAGASASEIDAAFDEPREMTLFSWGGPIDTVMTPLDSIKYYALFLQTGMVSIDPTTGYVKAWVGGIDYKYFKVDHVKGTNRQVGSTFKPFVYATAIAQGTGIGPCTEILNQRVQFLLPTGQYWEPKNSDGSVGGIVTLRHGLATSANLVTARLMKDLIDNGPGPQKVVEYARMMGIESPMDPVPSLCLGTADLTVMEMTSAYCTFANEGQHIAPAIITRIEDRNGNVLEEFVPRSRQVFDKETNYIMVELMRGVVDLPGGTSHRLRSRYKFENEIFGKTGTTQNQSDGWFMGGTPNLVTGIWVGGEERQVRFRSLRLGQGANMALPIWGLYMKALYADEEIGLPKDRFKRPETLSISLNCQTQEDEDILDPFSDPRESQPGRLDQY